MTGTLSKQVLESAHCWESDDQVPRQPEMTEFRRRLRFHQAQWRAAHGHPIGSQPIVPRPDGRPPRLVGSRIPLAYGRATGANFLTRTAVEAARARTAFIEAHQSFDHQRLWADLLSTSAMTFNLFGDLFADVGLADRAVHLWWPDTPGTVDDVRFAHSPGRLDPSYLANLVAFDVAFVQDLGAGARGIVGVMTAYHEVNKPQAPKPSRLARYREITETSGVFGSEAIDAVNGTHLVHIWLAHLLVLSMLRHPSRTWRWGRFVVVHPAGNSDFADACARYRALLVDPTTFASVTVEALLDAEALSASTVSDVRDRYLGF